MVLNTEENRHKELITFISSNTICHNPQIKIYPLFSSGHCLESHGRKLKRESYMVIHYKEGPSQRTAKSGCSMKSK